MESLVKWFNIAIPRGWDDIVVRFVKVAVVTFVVRQAQDWLEVGTFDTIPNATDALVIGGAILALNAILFFIKR